MAVISEGTHIKTWWYGQWRQIMAMRWGILAAIMVQIPINHHKTLSDHAAQDGSFRLMRFNLMLNLKLNTYMPKYQWI